MNRPPVRVRSFDPSKRIRLLVDQHDKNNNDLINSTIQPSSTNKLSVSHSSTSIDQTLKQSNKSMPQLPQRSVPQMPFVSGMEREEEAEYHLQNALDAQCRLGSAKIRAVPIPDLYADPNSQTIYPANIQLPKQLIRLQPLQLESDEPEYDMDQTDHNWFKSMDNLCPNLTHIEFETIIDKLENSSTRTLVSLDEARALFALSNPSTTNDLHIKTVYDFWHQRRTTRDKRLKPRLLTERDVKEEKGKYHPYVAFRRRVEKMTTRKNRKNDEQAYLSMLKLRSNFETVVKLTNLIKLRETTKASWFECALSIFKARCDLKSDDDLLSTMNSSSNTKLDSHHHIRSNLKRCLSTNNPNQQLIKQLIRLQNYKKNQLKTSTLTNLLQTPVRSDDLYQQKIKRFKKTHPTDKLTQLLSSPTTPSTPNVHNISSLSPQSILERLSSANGIHSNSSQRRRIGKNPRNLSSMDLWSLAESTPGGASLLKAQLFEAARKLQEKEDLENNLNRRVILQDDASVLSSTNEIRTSIDDDDDDDDEQTIDPWQFRPKHGCRYLRPIDQDQQQRVPTQRSSFSTYHSLACSKRGQLGKRRIRIGRGGRLLYDRHIEQENNDSLDEIHSMKSYLINKPVLWEQSSNPLLTESYQFHSHLTVHNHTKMLEHHYQTKSCSSFDSIDFNNSFSSLLKSTELECSSYHINQALKTLIEPEPPSPSTSPPLPSTNSLSTSQQIMIISTPPTPPPSSSSMINNNEIDSSQQTVYTKPSTTYVLPPSTPYFPSDQHTHVVPSTPPPYSLVQYVQLHRILPSTTPVTTSDS